MWITVVYIHVLTINYTIIYSKADFIVYKELLETRLS